MARESWRSRAQRYWLKAKKERIKHFYICGKCRGRRTLAKELWQYSAPPKCCGGIYWLIDMYSYRQWQKKIGRYAKRKCGASYWQAPHRPGSMLECLHSKVPIERLRANGA